jgi:lariat debranching enzyme
LTEGYFTSNSCFGPVCLSGHFETMPFDRSTMRSIYHIRHLSVSKLLLLPPSSSSSEPDQQASTSTSPSPFPPQTHPSIFLSHDWPLSIAPHGDLPTLLRRKPFFADEIRDNTLGSKPLLQVLKVLKPRWWFAAHLHVKFAAIWRHDSKGREEQPALQAAGEGVGEVRNPDEIVLEDEDEGIGAGAGNPDEIKLDDEEEEIDAAADKVEKVETKEVMDDADVSSKGKAADMVNPDEITLEDDGDDEVPHTHLPPPSSTLPSRPPPEVLTTTPSSSSPPDQEQGLVTKFLALDKCLPNKDYLQILEIPTPVANPSSSPSSTSSSPSTSTSSPSTPNLTYDPYWLAITRALHPFLALSARQGPLPSPEQLKKLVEKELDWVETNGMGFAENGFEGKKAVGEVQRFWRTAPCVGEAGGGPGTCSCHSLLLINPSCPFMRMPGILSASLPSCRRLVYESSDPRLLLDARHPKQDQSRPSWLPSSSSNSRRTPASLLAARIWPTTSYRSSPLPHRSRTDPLSARGRLADGLGK